MVQVRRSVWACLVAVLDLCEKCRLVLCDGVGIVWVKRVAGYVSTDGQLN